MTKPQSTLPAAPQERTLVHMLERQAALFGARAAMQLGDTVWSHAQSRAHAAARASALRAAGIQRGDRVAILSATRPEYLEAFLGCGWCGAVSVPINTASQGPQIQYFVANSQSKLLIIEAQYLERLQSADLAASGLELIWVLDASADQLQDLGNIKVRPWPGATTEAAAEDMRPGDILAILYTSGTTGPSKGVLCSHAHFYWWGLNTLKVLSVTSADTLCTTLPMFHINALNTYAQAMLAGGKTVFVPKFSASGFWATMHASQATVIYLLGAMVPILLAQPQGAHERGHHIRTGLGPGVPEQANQEFFERTGVRLLEGYGSTETSFVIAAAPDSPRRGVMGWLMPGFDARVANEDDVELPDGQAGELLLRAHEPYAFASGYFNMPDKTVEAWRNLWFHTGDRVVRDPDGAYRFIDRLKDAIRRRGENISSYEVEQVLASHPAVATVAVYPVQSELAEDEVMAAIIVQPGVDLRPEELVQWCESRLQAFAIPRYIDLVEDLPRTENGKIQKFKLRERGLTPSTWERPQTKRKPAP